MEATLPAVLYLAPLVGFFKRLRNPEAGEQAEAMSCFQVVIHTTYLHVACHSFFFN